MTPRWITAGILAAIVALSAILYFDRIDFAPPHIQIDEAMIAINANAIATTGRDLRNEHYPLYAQTAEHSWYQPMVIYVEAITLKLLPLSEWTVRAPTVIFGLADILLMFLVAHQLLGSVWIAAASALILALSPGHFIHSRYGMDYLYPIAFILGWMLCLMKYLQRPRPWLLVLAVSILGVGFYCYISSIVMMPLYFAMTLFVLYERSAPPRTLITATAAFVPWLVPFLIWISGHPAAFTSTVDKYGIYDTAHLNAAQGLRSLFSFLEISKRLSQYWNYFDPSFLFFGAGIKVQFSTNLAGIFLLPTAVFMAAGCWHAAKHRSNPFNQIILIGFVTAPLAAIIPAEENAIFRSIGLVPFGVLLAALGVYHLWHAAKWTKVMRVATIALLLLMVPQFRSFRQDYFTSYRERVAFWLGGNIRGALEELIDRAQPADGHAVYFTSLTAGAGQLDWRNGFLDTYWRFYLIKHQREDLLSRTMTMEPAKLDSIPAGSIVLSNSDNTTVRALVKSGTLTSIAIIPELDGHSFFEVLRR